MKTVGVILVAHLVLVSVLAETNEQRDLLYAIKNGDENATRSLIQSGINLRTNGTFGMPLLMESIFRGRDNIAKLLIEVGVDCNQRYGLITPLRAAISKGRTSIVESLVKNKVDVNESIFIMFNNQVFLAETSLMYAVKKNRKEIVEVLLENGADVNTKDTHGKTAKDYVVGGSEDIRNILIKYEQQQANRSNEKKELFGEDKVIEVNVRMKDTDKFGALKRAVQLQVPQIDLSGYKIYSFSDWGKARIHELYTLRMKWPDFDGYVVQVKTEVKTKEKEIQIVDVLLPHEETTGVTEEEAFSTSTLINESSTQ